MTSFILSPDISEEDWDPLFAVDMRINHDSPEIQAFLPGGLSPAHRAANISGFKQGVFGGPVERVYAKITETSSGEIVSFLSARVYRGPKGIIDGDLANEPPPIKLPPNDDLAEKEFYEWFWNQHRAALRGCKEMQRPHVYLQVVGTDPAWQRKGAATMLINWLLDFVAKEGLGRCALGASPMASGSGFYEKFGFRAVDTLTFVDEDRFPGRRGTPIVIMVKDL
jgi:GNAT superfamily N-acetyltransferase